MHLRRLAFPAIALAMLTASAAFAQTTTATTSQRTLTSPPIGLGSSETVQLNVVNTASASSSGTAASCTGTISFLNAAGAAIGTATSFTIGSGQISAVTLPFSRVGATGLRTEVRAAVTLTVTQGSGVPCELVSTLETYDTSTGATHVHLDGESVNGGGLRH